VVKVTVTKPAKTKSWNPRDRYFWSVYFSSILFFFCMALTRIVEFASIEYWVINIVAFLLWWVFVNFVMGRWVFGPQDG
jgi:hypothetical protein